VRPVVVLSVALSAAIAACSSTGSSFDPSGPCTGDGQRAGAYPDLEAQVPAVLERKPPNRLDSGRNCTIARLGTLARHGINELRFAGGLWETGSRSGTTLAVFSAPSLTSDLMAEFYEVGARASTKTENVQRSSVRVGGILATRIDTLNDQSFQTIAVLPSSSAGLVRVALVATDVREVPDRERHELAVESAVKDLADQDQAGR
jgi:hypothetical protein